MNETSNEAALKAAEAKYFAWAKSVANNGDNGEPLPVWSEMSLANRLYWANIKPWWKSRTLWVNAGLLALAAAETQLHFLQGVLPGGLFPWLAFGLPVVNAALRLITTTAVGK